MAGYQKTMDEFIELQKNIDYLERMRNLGFEFYKDVKATPYGLTLASKPSQSVTTSTLQSPRASEPSSHT